MRHAAVRLYKQGVRVEIIAKSLKLDRRTVFYWLRKFRLQGWKALKSSRAPGAQTKLQQKQIFKLIEMLKQPAAEYGFNSDLWTGPRVKMLIRKKFHVNLHKKHIPRFLRRLGLVRKSPERRAMEQDEKAVRRWVRYELPRIKRLVSESKGLLLYGDEAMYFLIPYVGKTWAFPDMKPVARVSGKRGVRVGVTSAVSPQGHLVFQLAEENFNASTLVRFLKALHHHFARKKLFFVMDGAKPHTAKTVKAFAEKNKTWLSLHYLPAYSPELNPDEEVWNHTKTKKLSGRPMRDEQALRSAVMGSLRSLQKRPELVKSFFTK